MSGTSIVSKWHLVSFRVLIVCLFHHISPHFLHSNEATGQAKVVRSVDDSQSSQRSAKGMLCLWVMGLDRSNLDGSKMGGQR